MRVALNAIHLVPGETGGFEIYARRLIPALEAADPDLRLSIYASGRAVRQLAAEGWRAELVPVRVDARSRPRAVLAEQVVLPRLLRALRPDLLHNLMSTAPAVPRIPQVTTIHDVIYRRFPQTHRGLLSVGLRILVSLAARRSTRVIAVSAATRDDLVSLLGLRTETIDVVPNGPGSPPGPAAPEEEVRTTLALGDRRLVLAVSAKRPHKNLERLIEAMASVDATLVLPGYPTPFTADLQELASRRGVSERVRFAGWLEGPLLEGLYRAADAFVLPSLAEGFGMPVLEAMARGAPVACSELTVLREVAGDAALYFDPERPDEIAGAIRRLLADGRLRDDLVRLGRERAARFSWEAAARATLASYRKALDGR